MTTIITGIAVAFFVAIMARQLKISEFRQIWINEIRKEISEYITKADEWSETYLDYNLESAQEKKAQGYLKLNTLKYEAFRLYRSIEIRFKLDDDEANELLSTLINLLDPKFSERSAWREEADKGVLQTRMLLKKEWETTKNPFGTIAAFRFFAFLRKGVK
ncbi:hypothetical protein [Erwinia mallotivora]|uniref:hypothetical protein n=1 Tax=Erwinia mallotivora TaxID=69222 RepID=UPI0021BFA9BB|nr:hypothetical protein [Erwinia mallotivora]